MSGARMDVHKDRELDKIRSLKFKELIRRMSDKESNMSVKDKPVEVSDQTFDSFVKDHPLVAVDCWAAWCGPCRMVAPIVDALAKDYAGKIAFGKLNVDENTSIPARYGIMSIPTLLVFKNGALVDRVVGAMPRGNLEKMITRHL